MNFFDTNWESFDTITAALNKRLQASLVRHYPQEEEDVATNQTQNLADPDIFSYADYKKFLRDYFDAKRQQNPKFSFRVFARQSGIATGSTPKMVMDGKRKLTIESARKFAKGFALNKRQTLYLEALVEYEQAPSIEAKGLVVEKIKTIVPKHKIAKLGQEYTEYLTSLNLITLREMTYLHQFKENTEWLAQTLKSKMTSAEIKESFSRLTRLGLITKNNNGKWMAADPIVSTAAEVHDIDVSPVHHDLLGMAQKALIDVPGHLRHNTSLTFPVPLRKMETLKKHIMSFMQSLIELVDDGKNDFDEVFHLSVALFPATNVKGKKS